MEVFGFGAAFGHAVEQAVLGFSCCHRINELSEVIHNWAEGEVLTWHIEVTTSATRTRNLNKFVDIVNINFTPEFASDFRYTSI